MTDPFSSFTDIASETFDVGVDLGSPVSLDYFDRARFKFDGKIEDVAEELNEMKKPPMTRRTSVALTRADSKQAPADARPKEAAEALTQLKEGNARFVSGRLRHAHQAANWRKHLKSAQQPFATILACSDSRVPPELVFDQGFGDLFVIRVAGNIIATDVLGSVQYATRHLHTPLVVVMGHESCGAVTAAVDALQGRGREPRFIAALVAAIEPGLKGLPADLEGADRVHAAVEANVRWSMRQLAALPESQLALKRKKSSLVGAVYDIAKGTVRFLD
jgi:carbonic anhydrase